MFPRKALDVRIYTCCEQDQTLDLAKHLHHSVAGTQARFPLASHFIDFTLCCVCGVVLPGQTECSVLSWWRAYMQGLWRQALTLPQVFTFPSHYWLKSLTTFHTVLWHAENTSFQVVCAQRGAPTSPENEGGQFWDLCMLRILFKCRISPYTNIGQIIVRASL